MNNQKLEPILNLALDVDEPEREKSEELMTGYDETTKRWDLIIRYSGNLEFLSYLGVNVVYLMNNYAIINVPERLVNSISEYEEIIYVEKPKRVYFEVSEGIRASCINSVQVNNWREESLPLYGEGVICALIDSGIDYAHPAFRNPDGTTRIISLWDQSAQNGEPPDGYNIGTLYSAEQINEALSATNIAARYSIVPSRDLSGHGTHVAGIMAGNFAADRNNNIGIATRSELIVVKLGNPIANGFPRTSEIMQALNYIVNEAIRLNRPAAINLSFGNNYGSHDGTSLIETFIYSAIDSWQTVLCTGSGNEGAAAGHAGGFVTEGEVKIVEYGVGEFQSSFSIQIWKSFVDEFELEISSPGLTSAARIQSIPGTSRYRLAGTEILVYYGEPSPYSRFQEIYIEFVPNGEFVESGVWTISLLPIRIVEGRYDMWLPVSGSLNVQTQFLSPSADTTLTIPSTSFKTITVGAYDSRSITAADFSGRGYTRLLRQIKPDIVAPGVNIVSAAPGGGRETRSGTSMACPFVGGSAALMMEWGIVRGNNPYLYGEKVKAYLIRGARQLPGFVSPNPVTGWGALCVRDSLLL